MFNKAFAGREKKGTKERIEFQEPFKRPRPFTNQMIVVYDCLFDFPGAVSVFKNYLLEKTPIGTGQPISPASVNPVS